ncbi:MAG: class I SAM-dependent methyltransferase [Alphaproteobacteria bacterium]|nr:class I SAM-dependent methyltransferase [Alphaproteobacteria bacterium]
MSHAVSPAEFLRDGPHNGPRVTQAKGHDIIDCFACGFRHVLPLPDPATLEQEYREKYYAAEKPTFITHAREDQTWFELAQNDRLAIFEKLVGGGRRRLLDIGCGPGFFLKTALSRGWNAHGIEPSSQAAAHARSLGASVTEGFFNDQSAAALDQFDVVNLTNVLEHVPDAAATLRRAANLLAPGGVLCVGVPNDFSLLQIAARGAVEVGEWWLAPPHHLNYFDFESLEGALLKLELTLVERTTSFPMEAFLMMGENYVGDPALGRACHSKRKNFDLAFEKSGLTHLRRDFYKAMAKLGIGREAVVIAVKPASFGHAVG